MPPPDDHTDDGRLIALDGTTNTRDVGGYATRDGRIVRHGRLLRSAHLDALTGAGRARFAALPVATVVDFRGREEGAGAPDFTPARRLHVAIEPTIGTHLRRRREAGGIDAAIAAEVMRETYREYVTHRPDAFAAVFHSLLEAPDHATLIHCTAGKDRTGTAAALVLAALDVPRETIVADYLLSNDHWRPKPATTAEWPPEVRQTVLKVRPEYLAAAFDAIDSRWGSLDTFLSDALGVGPAERRELARTLTRGA